MAPPLSAGSCAREFLHQHEGRAQIGLDVAVPARARHLERLVALEHRGVVDETAERTERRRPRPAPAPPSRPRCARSAAERHGLAAAARDLGDQRLGRLARAVIMHRDRPAVGGERQGDGAADALRPAGDERRARHGARRVGHRGQGPCRRPRALALASCLGRGAGAAGLGAAGRPRARRRARRGRDHIARAAGFSSRRRAASSNSRSAAAARMRFSRSASTACRFEPW